MFGLSKADIEAMGAHAWDRVASILNHTFPQWKTHFNGRTATDSAVAAIQHLVKTAKNTVDIDDLLKALQDYKSKYPHRGIEVRGELEVLIHPEQKPVVERIWLGKNETKSS